MNPTPILETTLNNTQIFVYDEPFNSDLVHTKAVNIYLFNVESYTCCTKLACSNCYFKTQGSSCIPSITKFLHSTFEHSHPEAFV